VWKSYNDKIEVISFVIESDKNVNTESTHSIISISNYVTPQKSLIWWLNVKFYRSQCDVDILLESFSFFFAALNEYD